MIVSKITYSLAIVLALAASPGFADIVNPAQVACTVKSITPTGAKFFGFGKGPIVGDTARLDLEAREIVGIDFASGAHIGSTVRPHPLVKQASEFTGLSLFQADFHSQANRRHYIARLVATEFGKSEPIRVSLDVVEDDPFGRLAVNSLEMDCARQ